MTRRIYYRRWVDGDLPQRRVIAGRRLSTTARGYGSSHQQLRAQWKPRVDRGEVCCARCQRPIPPAGKGRCPAVHKGVRCGKDHQGWDLGHNDEDRAVYSGPEHECCNRGAPGRRRSGG